MAEWLLKYADNRGEIHQEVVEASSELDLRDRFTQQGFFVYSIRPRPGIAGLAGGLKRKARLNMERFLVFNQQFVTLVKAGLPILKSLDLLADRLTDPKLGRYVKAVRDDVRNGALLSDAFRAQGIFPPIYVTWVMAGEKSGSLAEVLDRYITYQRLALSVRKKILVSLIYPSFLVVLVICLIVFLVTYVVPNFADLYRAMEADLPAITKVLIAVGTTARNYILAGVGLLAVGVVLFRVWSRGESAKTRLDRVKRRTPLLGEIWIKFQVAQFSRVLSTLLT